MTHVHVEAHTENPRITTLYLYPQTSAASESVSATTARKMRYSRETETWAKDTVNSRRHDMFSRLFRDYQSDLKKRKLLPLDDDDGKFSSSLYFAEDQWSDWVLTNWHMYSRVHNSPPFGLFMMQNAYVPVGGNERGKEATPTSISVFDFYGIKTLWFEFGNDIFNGNKMPTL